MDQIACPSCGKAFRIDASYQGQSFKCHCGTIVEVPAGPGAPPPPPPPPPPPGYGAARPAAQESGSGTTAFVLGLLGLILCAVCAPFAWSIGGKEKRRREQLGLPPDGMATAGYIMGIIGTVLLILGVVAGVIWLVVVLAFVGNMH